MKIIPEILISLAILACYCYTLIAAHTLLAGIDKKIRFPRHSGEIINIKSVKALVSPAEPGVKKAIMLLRLGNYLVYLYFAMLAGALVFGYPPPLNGSPVFFRIIHH
jgi:hypothetical protein